MSETMIRSYPTAGAVVAVLFLASDLSSLGSEPLTSAVYGPAVAFPGHGDVWTSTWADDGELYALCDDPAYIDGTSFNWAINRLSGNDPRRLVRTVVNKMEEYGRSVSGPEKLTWKGNSILSVDGVLYATVSRHDYPSTHTPPLREQTTQDGSIIKSFDHGKTWTRSMKENWEHPTFPGRKFSSPFFIQYGKDCSVKADGSDRFVYAVANDGYWNNGNMLILGRVPRSKIGNLCRADWEFYRGGDGMKDSAWTRDLDRASPVLNEPEQVGTLAAAYIPQRQRYFLIQWFYAKNRYTGLHSSYCIPLAHMLPVRVLRP